MFHYTAITPTVTIELLFGENVVMVNYIEVKLTFRILSSVYVIYHHSDTEFTENNIIVRPPAPHSRLHN